MDDPKYQADAPIDPRALPPGDIIISPDTLRTDRVPPGQSRTRKWPVLDAMGTPRLPALDQWELVVFGLVDTVLKFDWESFRQLPRVKVFADFHCVTRWSRLGNLWEGVPISELLSRAGVKTEAKFVILHAYDQGWTTNLPLADFRQEDVLLADTHDGEAISAEHGGPVRAMVPRLYAWKSAKWLRGIELSASDKPGYWERGGYHLLGDPWREQRFRDDPDWQ
jgi:DMSO/TMAO reductase YedYZ molybdopterin-dependent catalytic subunit